MKSIENFKNQELAEENLTKICGGITKVVNVGNSIVDDLNGLIR